MICKNCNSKKSERYCSECNSDTPTLYIKAIQENTSMHDSLRNLQKSHEKIRGKPKREIEQYVGNKDENVISEFERIRSSDKTTVIHRLWRRIDNHFKKVHEHKK
ncbi:MAG: hypothetical protein KAI57_02775 [Candidatus Pacebacteria bacterium]|nr:hypothetical protein [Candidatus Paceibacterota bacterium]